MLNFLKFNICIFLLCACNRTATTRITISAVPKNTPPADTLYFASSYNGWNPHLHHFQAQPDGTYRIELPDARLPLEFKVTRGDWGKVETTTDGNQIKNRKYKQFSKNKNIKIEGWNDMFLPKSTCLPTVRVVDNAFFIPQLNAYRRVRICLPSNYDTATERYPVLYMHDGQNLFDVFEGINGEWGVDEALQRLEKENKLKLIVVAIDNGEEERINEYTAWAHQKYGGGKGELYADFIVKTLKPFIDKQYRTKTDRENTGIMGSSLGGLVSMSAGMQYPETFGKLGIFSPSFWFSEGAFEQVKTRGYVANTKIFMNAGRKEGKEMVQGVQKMTTLLQQLGYTEKQLKTRLVKGGKHNEAFWESEFEGAVLWLFE